MTAGWCALKNMSRASNTKIIKLPRMRCNALHLGRYYCPDAKWLMVEPCPFVNKNECKIYQEMCGAL
jgi:hypothetical protein